jgi:hypothetical protein
LSLTPDPPFKSLTEEKPGRGLGRDKESGSYDD